MDLKSRWRKCVDSGQIKALIWKDVLVRLRQPVRIFDMRICFRLVLIVSSPLTVAHGNPIHLAVFDFRRSVRITNEIRCRRHRRLPVSDAIVAWKNDCLAILPIVHLHH